MFVQIEWYYLWFLSSTDNNILREKHSYWLHQNLLSDSRQNINDYHLYFSRGNFHRHTPWFRPLLSVDQPAIWVSSNCKHPFVPIALVLICLSSTCLERKLCFVFLHRCTFLINFGIRDSWIVTTVLVEIHYLGAFLVFFWFWLSGVAVDGNSVSGLLCWVKIPVYLY